jgi:hypothetical protein
MGLVAFAVGGVWLISWSWITPWEKKAVLHALDRVDEVKQASTRDESAYQAKVHEAGEAVKNSNRVAFTQQDKVIAKFR